MAGEMILHSDLNCFYASVEMNENPYLRGKAIAVCGSTEDRHGIVLTASYPAKRMGVKTGAANWQARQCCPGLICVPPHYELYLKYTKLVRRINARYTDYIEGAPHDCKKRELRRVLRTFPSRPPADAAVQGRAG